MKKLASFFPFNGRVKKGDIVGLIITIVLYIVVAFVLSFVVNFVAGILNIGIISLIASILNLIIWIYEVLGIVFAIIGFIK